MSGKPKFHVQPGDRFGRGVVLREMRIPDNRDKMARWAKLLCDCKTIYDVRIPDLFKPVKPTRSCGCLMRETASATMSRPENLDRLAAYARSKEGRATTVAFNKATKRTHGLTRTHPLYGTWSNMMTRCYNASYPQYKDWGGRGITVCERWKDPRLFIEDIEREIGPRPPGMTLDRTDNNSDYGPGKVQWATRVQQVRNSRRFIDGNRSGPMYSLWWNVLNKRKGGACERWQDFTAFTTDIEAELGPKPEGCRFARLDTTRSYGPGNVAWLPGARGPAR